jgi:hypothetical protein
VVHAGGVVGTTSGTVARRSRNWILWLAGALSIVAGVVAIVVGAVMADAASGRFGRVPVPGHVVGSPQPGEYIVADGEYGAARHDPPVIEVRDPDGNPLEVRSVGPVYRGEDNAIAAFVVAEPGPHEVTASVDPQATRGHARTVIVERVPSEATVAAAPAVVVIVSGLAAVAIGAVLLLVALVVTLTRRPRRGPPVPQPWRVPPAAPGWPPPPGPASTERDDGQA